MCSYSAITLSDNLAKMNNTPSCANEYSDFDNNKMPFLPGRVRHCCRSHAPGA